MTEDYHVEHFKLVLHLLLILQLLWILFPLNFYRKKS